MDPIVDMLNRIRNAQAVFHQTVDIPFSNLKYEIAKILEKEKLIDRIEKKGKKIKKIIRIVLKYEVESGSTQGRPVISGLKRVSKLGQRIYAPVQNIKRVKRGYGIVIISTSKGLMTGKEARKQKLGGEVLCEIW
ncbi:30S ribosomal protein S8 [Patescibacteria group bacterium]|nr:30S ribosomal protein S8 [Patescibacteria group bacterium]